MGFFSRNKANNLPWEHLTSLEQLNAVLEGAKEKPVLLFKHSTRCGISSMAMSSFENGWTSENELANIFYLDLIRHRDISNAIAEQTGVMHQSPQVIVLKGEEVIYSASHSSIDAQRIETILKSA